MPSQTKPFGKIDKQADEPVRKTEGGRYGEDSELSPEYRKPTEREKAGRSYFAPKGLRNKVLDESIEAEGG